MYSSELLFYLRGRRPERAGAVPGLRKAHGTPRVAGGDRLVLRRARGTPGRLTGFSAPGTVKTNRAGRQAVRTRNEEEEHGMNRLSRETIEMINNSVYFRSGKAYEAPPVRPWQYVLMEYRRVGLTPPGNIPDFESMEQAEFWLCLDGRYNARLKQLAMPAAV